MINIEIDGIPLKVDSSQMIIQVADEAGIDIPRFCYHKKLSIAANCRMCLVEIDKARKPMPACSTPVSEGMKVYTHSKTAMNAQRSVMEFLLINHPLDCPICDQGGECELQDLSMGYGAGISRFSEGKRSVADKDIGPLVQTEMTRCIHCTRCVRFGQEIGGIKELGATGRGEHMEIGTYVEHSLESELSGNIIDLCPVGALTSKPFRYKARAWEMAAHPTIAPHDAIGSALECHVRGNDVMRVVPCDNEAINETWISDRDRFGYLGLNHQNRLLQPQIKVNGQWQVTDWQTALEQTVNGLQNVITQHGAEQLAGLMSPTASVEEGYLFQRWLRRLGCENIDHRLTQQDFSDGAQLNALSDDWSLESLQESDSIVLIGCDIRSEAPIMAHRLRQAALDGALVTDLNFYHRDLLMPVEASRAMNVSEMLDLLTQVLKAIQPQSEEETDYQYLLPETDLSPAAQNLAMQLTNAQQATIIVGELANTHPQAADLRGIANLIAELTGARLIIMPQANSRGLSAAGVLPKTADSAAGMDAAAVWLEPRQGYVLHNFEPEFDTSLPQQALQALEQAEYVVAISSFDSESLRRVADVILPLAAFAETSGTFVGVDQSWQSFGGVVKPRGESRPGWKIYRVLANLTGDDDVDYVSSAEVMEAARQTVVEPTFTPQLPTARPEPQAGLQLICPRPMYRTDSLLRHSEALQQTPVTAASRYLRVNRQLADELAVADDDWLVVMLDDAEVCVPVKVDDDVAAQCVILPATTEFSAALPQLSGQIQLAVMQAEAEHA